MEPDMVTEVLASQFLSFKEYSDFLNYIVNFLLFSFSEQVH